MNLDRPRRYAQFVRCNFIGVAFDQLVQHFVLSLRQKGKHIARFYGLRGAISRLASDFQCAR